MKDTDPNSFIIELKQLALDPDAISKNNDYQADELVWVAHKSEPLGLYWIFDLKNYIQKQGLQHGPQVGELLLCPVESKNELISRNINDELKQWWPLFDHPFFQRRQEDSPGNPLSSSDGLFEQLSPGEEEFFLLLHGQKSGPYSFEQIKDMVSSKQVLVTDMVSIDNGKSWGRLYEIEEFDRRDFDLVQSELPYRPISDLESEQEMKEKLHQQWKERKESDTQTIAGLAYVENIRSGKIRSSRDNVFEQISSPFGNDGFLTRFFYVAVTAFSLAGLSFLLWPTHQSDNTSLAPTTTATERVEMLEPTERFDAKRPEVQEPERSSASQEQPRRQRQRQRPRMGEHQESQRDRSFSRESTPFRQTETYKRAQRQRNQRQRGRSDNRRMREPASLEVISAEREDLYYDDASGSLELDPVRETLSRDIIDPTDEYGDYYYDDYNDYDDYPHRHIDDRSRNVSSYPPEDIDYEGLEEDEYYEDTYYEHEDNYGGLYDEY